MSPQEAQDLIQFHKTHKSLQNIGDGSDYFGIRFISIHTQWVRDIVFRIVYNLVGEIRKTTDQIVYPEMIGLNEWPIGGVQEPHLDTYSSNELEHGTFSKSGPAREWTCILYLNDDFKGGRTYVPDEEVYEPETGSGLLFQGIYIPHGVEKVRRNSRHTISFWFTQDEMKQMVQHPVYDLNLDEDSYRLQHQN